MPVCLPGYNIHHYLSVSPQYNLINAQFLNLKHFTDLPEPSVLIPREKAINALIGYGEKLWEREPSSGFKFLPAAKMKSGWIN